jgi:hypothetical protein
MSLLAKEDINQAAAHVRRSPRTIRRWADSGVDIRDLTNLEVFANRISDRTFGRYGNGAQVMGANGGSRTSVAKKESSKLNGKRGGRPKDGMLLLRRAIRNANQLDLRNASDEDLKTIWPSLMEVYQYHMFWIADTLNEIARRYGESSADLAIKHSPNPRKFREFLSVIRTIYGPGTISQNSLAASGVTSSR